MTLPHTLVEWLLFFEWMVLLYFIFVHTFYFILLASAVRELSSDLRAHWGETRLNQLGSGFMPRISIIAPAHNEARTITDSVRALLSLSYPCLEIVVVDDGSNDGTLAVLQQEFQLTTVHPIYEQRLRTRPLRAIYRSMPHPQLVVLEKDNGGKSDALNMGLNQATGEFVCSIDADTVVEPDALQRMILPFLRSSEVVATGGTIRPVNGSVVRAGRVVQVGTPRHWLAGIQVVEYLRAFLFARLGWNHMGGNLIISGAFGLFQREALIQAGGYLPGTVGEDMEMIVRLRRHGYDAKQPGRITFVPDPVAWTEVPDSLRPLGRQRDRWHRGLAEVLWKDRNMFLNPRYGALGLIVFPYYIFVELLAPIVEALGFIALILSVTFGLISWDFAALFFLVAYGLGLLLSICTLVLEEVAFHRLPSLSERWRLLLWTGLEYLGYHQLTVWYRLRGLIKFSKGSTEWGHMEKRGFLRGRLNGTHKHAQP